MPSVQLYRDAYADPRYKTGPDRLAQIERLLGDRPGGSYLDVGCGRGEAVNLAAELGYSPVGGVDIVPELCHGCIEEAALPHLHYQDGHSRTVSCFDVLEHLEPMEIVPCLRELARVCSWRLILTISDTQDPFHVTLMSKHAWSLLLDRVLFGWSIERAEWADTGINIAFTAERVNSEHYHTD